MALSPTATLKLKNRACAYKMKHGSPRLQEVLREKCRDRMRQKRDQLFNKRRLGLEIDTKVQDTLMDIVHEEFKNIVTTSDDNVHLKFMENDEPLALEAAIELENQIIHEEEQWILQEYDKIWQDEVEHLIAYIDNESKDVFCPMCQKALLIEDSNCVHCTVCELKLNNRKLEEVRYLISESMNAHAFSCVHPPKFTAITDDGNFNLYLICKNCSTLALIC